MTIFEKLNGKKLDVRYEGSPYHYHISYLSEEQLKWVAQHNLDEGELPEEVESYFVKEITPNIYNVNWIESDGFTVSQVLDFNTNSIIAFLSWNEEESKRGSSHLQGTFNLI